MNRINALIYPREFSQPFCHVKTPIKETTYEADLIDTKSAGTLILDSLASRSMRNRCVKALSLQYFCCNTVRGWRWNSRDLQRISLEQAAECWSTFVCEETKQDWKKNHPERLEAIMPSTHTISLKAPTANNQAGKKKISWFMGHWAEYTARSFHSRKAKLTLKQELSTGGNWQPKTFGNF